MAGPGGRPSGRELGLKQEEGFPGSPSGFTSRVVSLGEQKGHGVRTRWEVHSDPTLVIAFPAGNTLGRSPSSVPNVENVTFGRRTSWSTKPGIV